MATKTKVIRKKTTRPAHRPSTASSRKSEPTVALKSYAAPVAKVAPRPIQKAPPLAKHRVHPTHSTRSTRPAPASSSVSRRAIRMSRIPQFAYMNAPGAEHGFEVGNTVEVFCDHERDGERTRGWIKGIVVQIDNKLVAVQFRSNVFLTDGWMVPDRILWYSLTSDQIRAATFAKRGSRKVIPDY
jgi:hypothetical protein